MVNNSTTKRSVDLCVGLDVIIVGIMDAMAGTTDAVEEIPSVKASARDTGRATMMHCGTAAAAAVDAVVVVMAAVAAVLAAVAAAVVVAVVAMVAVAVLMADAVDAISPYTLMPLPV
mgnify:CR=1 FL=1